jgi:hypothetical protein
VRKVIDKNESLTFAIHLKNSLGVQYNQQRRFDRNTKDTLFSEKTLKRQKIIDDPRRT